MPKRLRLLIIEDSADDAELMLLALAGGDYSVTHERVETAVELRAALNHGPWDLVLADYSLPALNAPTALVIVREVDPDLPFVVVSGTVGEEIASELLRVGASDYLLKGSLVRLVSIVKRELEATEQRRAHRAAAAAARQLASIVQSSGDAIIGKSLDGIITSWNPAAERLYGWTAVEAIGQPMGLIVPSERERELARIMERLRAGEYVPSFETERLRKDRTRVPISLTVSPIRDADGRLTGASKTARDLSEGKRAEALLARDALILANVRDAVIVTDLEGTVTYWNEGAARLFGWTAEEMLGRPLTERYPEPVREWLAEEIRARAAGAEWDGEFQDHRKDGSRVWIDARVTRLHDAAGQPVGILGISHDITERKRADETLQRSEAGYRTLVDSAVDMIYSHDLQGRFLTLNRAGEEILGYSLEEFLGMHLSRGPKVFAA